MHVHGGANADYMNGDTELVVLANKAHASHGTTSVFPSTTTGSFSQLDRMVDACESVQKSWDRTKGARIVGVHFYGPYFAEDKVGCHSPAGRRDPDEREYRHFLQKEIVKIATCASELPGALDFYRMASDSGCFITCGHCNAGWSELEAAFNEGMRHADYFWCTIRIEIARTVVLISLFTCVRLLFGYYGGRKDIAVDLSQPVPELPVADVEAAQRYYRAILGQASLHLASVMKY